MKKTICFILILLAAICWMVNPGMAQDRPKLSEATEACLSCHSSATPGITGDWGKSHHAKGIAQKDSIFNEAIEKKWVEHWLFLANSARFASAMSGTDYGVFANGRWQMNRNIQEMVDWLEFKLQGKPSRKR